MEYSGVYICVASGVEGSITLSVMEDNPCKYIIHL